jgi:hypothetical protein
MAKTNNRRHKVRRVSGISAFGTKATPRYQKGDYLRVELLSGVADSSVSIWLYVDHCDDRHAIVFGTIDSEPSEWLGNTLRSGAKLAVSYRVVREHRNRL